MSTTTESPSASRRILTREEWAERSVHTIQLHSGLVRWKSPDPVSMLRREDLSQDMLLAAIQVLLPDSSDDSEQTVEERMLARREAALRMEDLADDLIVESIVEPQINKEWLRLIDGRDRQILSELVQHQRNTDAAGRTIGVETLNKWVPFREEHGCPPDCGQCRAAQSRLSTDDMGDL